MDLEQMVKVALVYMKDAVWGHWMRWILLVVSLVIFPLFLGYLMRIFRGGSEPPDLEGWGRLFVDGLKYLAISIVYVLPGILVLLLSVIPLIRSFNGKEWFSPASLLVLLLGVLAAIILFILAAVLVYIAIVRAARTGRVRDAFQVGNILGHIRAIGWGSYIIAILVGGVISWLGSQVAFSPLYLLIQLPPELLLLLVSEGYAGLLIALLVPAIVIMLFLYVPVMIFGARFQALVYELGLPPSVGEAAAGIPGPQSS